MDSLQKKVFVRICLSFYLFFVLLPARSHSDEEKKTCADLELSNIQSGAEVIEAMENSYVNISFWLTTNRCDYPTDYFKVKVLKSERSLQSFLCTVIFQGEMCQVTQTSKTCFCSNKVRKWIWTYQKISRADQAIVVEWTDSVTRSEYKKKVITLLVHAAESHSTSLPAIVGSACGIALAVLLGVVIIRKCTHQGATDAKNQHPDEQLSEVQQTTVDTHTLVIIRAVPENHLHEVNPLTGNTLASQGNQMHSGNPALEGNRSTSSRPNFSSRGTNIQRQAVSGHLAPGVSLTQRAEGAMTVSGNSPPAVYEMASTLRHSASSAEGGTASYSRAYIQTRPKRAAVHRYSHLVL